MQLNAFQLKCIAVVTMVIDHVGYILYPGVPIFRMIGRISFPIFCFFIAEGVVHTRNIYRYMMRLGIFAIISEIPHDLAFDGKILEFGQQNIFFTLFLGVCMLYVLRNVYGFWSKCLVLAAFMCIADVMCVEYGFRGILLIFIYGCFREIRWLKLSAGALWNVLFPSKLLRIQYFGAFATIPLALYNGEKGKSFQYFFYLFYPLHLLVLYMIYIIRI